MPFIGSGRSSASLVKFMTEGPVIVMALEREDAVKKLREVMGATNPANAAEGTVASCSRRASRQMRSMVRTRRRPRRRIGLFFQWD